MELELILKFLIFGILANILGGLRYKLLGGKLPDILVVLIWLNIAMFVFSAIYYSFSVILFCFMIVVNVYYYRLYVKIRNKE